MLEAVPAPLQVHLRTPGYKQALFGTDLACLDGSPSSRIGHFNDCFLASPNDLGTYDDPEQEIPWLEEDTQCVGMGGELCKLPEDPTRIECPSARQETAASLVIPERLQF